MSDLISRAELFDELNRRGVPYNAEVNMVINGMPSAQPEIIRCKDCKRWNTIGDREKAEYGLCQNRSQLEATKRSDFCSRGERT